MTSDLATKCGFILGIGIGGIAGYYLSTWLMETFSMGVAIAIAAAIIVIILIVMHLILPIFNNPLGWEGN